MLIRIIGTIIGSVATIKRFATSFIDTKFQFQIACKSLVYVMETLVSLLYAYLFEPRSANYPWLC